MKTSKNLIILLTILMVATPCFGFSWINITNYNIEQLDWNSFRLNVDVSWGTDVGGYTPLLSEFYLSPLLGINQYNPGHGGDLSYMEPGYWECFQYGLGNSFSYDFDIEDGLSSGPITLTCDAQITYWDYHGEPGGPYWQTYEFSEFCSASTSVSPPVYAASVVPEPSSLILLGLGFFGGLGVIRFLR